MNVIEISKQLSEAYVERSEIQAELSRIKAEISAVEYRLTPPDGWPGSNQEKREVAKVASLEADPDYTRLNGIVSEMNYNLVLLEGTISALEAERRGQEWLIRSNLVNVLAGAAIERNGGDVEEQAFEDVADQELTEITSEEVAILQDELADDLPF